jgi:signal transduction histidine kinase
MKTLFWMAKISALMLGLLLASPCAAKDNSPYQYPETRSLVALVEAAATAVRQQGEKAFPAFRKEGSRWFHGDRYIFVWDLHGNRYVYPPDVEHERVNLLDLKDVGGKPIGKMIVETAAEGDGRGWVHYRWKRPHGAKPLWKSTYVVRAVAPSGKKYLVGSGIYQAHIERAFIVEVVKAAAALLEKKGRAAFATLRDPKSRFFFHDTYVFVTSAAGVELVNPAFPSLEGRNQWNDRDIKGKYLVRDYIKLALEKGEGWMSYYWPRPDAPQMPVKKTSYVKKVTVDGETMIVGAGMYE